MAKKPKEETVDEVLEDEDVALGDKVRDKVTGYTGIAIAYTVWLNGCVRWHIQPRIGEDGRMPLGEAFDEIQLEVLEKEAVPSVEVSSEVATRETGGPGGPSIKMERPSTPRR
jgi:hypothetical protein